MPLVSVIVPNYNHEAFLEQRIESILNQSFQDFEIILLDDNSTDDSRRILNECANNPKVSELLINTKNSESPFKQWQKGIELAKGTYIWIAESDDYADASFLEFTIQKLKTEKAAICYSQSYDVDESNTILSNRIEYTSEFEPNIWKDDFTMNGKEFVQKYLAEKNVIPNASAVVFKKSLLSNSFFSVELLSMKMCGDWFFWIQLCEMAEVTFVSKPLNYFRIHKDASRMHNDIQKKKRRILEEVTVRNFLYNKLKISIPKKNNTLLKSWCELYSKWAPFKTEFYKFKLFNIHSISLLLRFISVKLKSK